MGFQGPSGEGVRGIIAFIGIGSNLRDPAVQCRDAFRRIGAIPGIRLLRRSSLYRTEPVGLEDQPWFINAVAEIRTDLPPRKLFEALKEIERKMGRTDGPRWGPRVIDLDLLLYGQEVVAEEGLAIPHPETAPAAFCPGTALRARLLCDPSRLRRLRPRSAGSPDGPGSRRALRSGKIGE